MGQINCQVEVPQRPGEESASLTVGREFLLHCQGEWPAIKAALPELRLEETDKYKIQLLEFKFISTTEAELRVTSYKPGQHQIKAAQLVDAEHSVVLSDLSFTVNSVINPQEPPAEPFGPFGPLPLALSIWYTIGFLLMVLALVSALAWRWRIRAQRKKLLAEMRLDQQAQDPLAQFFQVVRKSQRKYAFFMNQEAKPEEVKEFVAEIGEAFKIYLARHLQVPTLKWSTRRILSDIKKNHRKFYDELGPQLKQNLAEIQRASQADNLSGKDCQQLLDILRKQVDQIDAYLRKEDAR